MLCATERETDKVLSQHPGVTIPINIEKRVEDKSHLNKVEQKIIMEKVLNLGARDWVPNLNSSCVPRGSLRNNIYLNIIVQKNQMV